MKIPRFLIYIIFVVAFVILGGSWLTFKHSKEVVHIDTASQPTIGDPSAKVHLVVFEEPKCNHCRDYNNQIFPLIKEQFVDTHQIVYTVVPLSFLPHSMPGANALLCIYNQDPGYPNADLFMKFLDNSYRNSWTSEADLMHIAEMTSPSIDLVKLENCMSRRAYEDQIEQNLLLAKKLQKEKFAAPAVYVDGKRVYEVTFKNIATAIEESH